MKRSNRKLRRLSHVFNTMDKKYLNVTLDSYLNNKRENYLFKKLMKSARRLDNYLKYNKGLISLDTLKYIK